ncbi:hypothetical protein [Ethanoligenens sp.]|uniref:hypothetical protein n=1 Tax=Ethanoligenens sp. TaxID=2099655 RepID=UPI0039EA020A
MQSKITGELDISGIQVGNPPTTTVNNTLGRRLGDCSTSSQTLTVMAGGTAYTVTFNQNYTSMDNATIISAINSVLGDSAVSQEYVYNQYQSEITNWYGEYLNNTSAGIAAGATAYSTDGVSIQVSGTTQIGIAAEDINPGAYGRVRLKG